MCKSHTHTKIIIHRYYWGLIKSVRGPISTPGDKHNTPHLIVRNKFDSTVVDDVIVIVVKSVYCSSGGM